MLTLLLQLMIELMTANYSW